MISLIGSVHLENGERVDLPWQATVDSTDEWIYVARLKGRYRMWSGGACSECSVDLLSVRRCEIHRDLVMVAVQCRLL